MTRPAAKGWCPGAYRPMMSGDGLVVRVRPVQARLSAAQMSGLCDLALRYGSGIIDLTSRANLQVRGVKEADHEALLQDLSALGLLQDDPDLESRRNILMTPFWQAGDAGQQIAADLVARLAEFPALPAKMGFAIDTGLQTVLRDCSADFRIERTADRQLLARADGAASGRPVTPSTAVDALIDMARWFVETGGPANRRMARHVQSTNLPVEWSQTTPADPGARATPGKTPIGTFFGAAFGQIDARHMQSLLNETGTSAFRVTPWRLFLLEGAKPAPSHGFITDPTDPLLSVNACPGAPFCDSASVETREISRALSRKIKGPLHVSGCGKGCAFPKPCRTTLIGRNGAFDLVRNGTAWEEPHLSGLSPDTLIDQLGDC